MKKIVNTICALYWLMVLITYLAISSWNFNDFNPLANPITISLGLIIVVIFFLSNAVEK